MTWLAPQLKYRVQVLKSTHDPNEAGGFDFGLGNAYGEGFEVGDFGYMAPLVTVWMGMKPLGYSGTGQKYIRGQQIDENVSHEFAVRKVAVAKLGREMGFGFSSGFKIMTDFSHLKSDYFLFLERRSSAAGRLFKIHGVIDREENREYLTVIAEEIEERGVGYPI